MRFFIKIFVPVIILFACILSVQADSWDDLQDIDTMWDGQKSVTNKEFEQVVDALEAKNKQKEEKREKKKFKKISGGGNALHAELSPSKDIIELGNIKDTPDEILSTLVYVKLFLDDNILEPGFYRVIAEKEHDGKYYAKFYQSDKYAGKYEINITEDDFDEEKLNFVKLVGYNDQFVKLIYGSMDLNAYAYIPYSLP